MRLEYSVEEDDVKTFAAWVLDEVGPTEGMPRRMGYAGTPIVGMLLLFLVRPESEAGMAAAVLGGMILWIVFWSSVQGATKRKVLDAYLRSDAGRAARGGHVLTLEPEGVREASRNAEVQHKWSAVRRLVRHEKAVYIMIGAHNGYIVPRTAFGGETTIDAFVQCVESYRREAVSRNDGKPQRPS